MSGYLRTSIFSATQEAIREFKVCCRHNSEEFLPTSNKAKVYLPLKKTFNTKDEDLWESKRTDCEKISSIQLKFSEYTYFTVIY